MINYTELAKELYPECDEADCFWAPSSYTPIIEYLGTVVLRYDEPGYQGDTYAILKKGDEYGFICFGWGSCSGCDALQGCNSYEDVGSIIQWLQESVSWYDSLDEVKQYVEGRNGENSYMYYMDEWETFVEQVMELK